MRSFTTGLAVAAMIGASALATTSEAATITDGFTFAVASDGADTETGTHFHSNSGGVFGNPAGKAETGRFSSEEVRGLSEYSLAGLTAAGAAFVTFDVFQLGGLFGQSAFNGTITVETYAGNNLEDIADYQATTVSTLGSFSTGILAVGDTLSFSITDALNNAIAGGAASLGVRLRADPLNADGALTFDTFRLTTDNQSTVVPVPAGILLLASGVAALGVAARRRRGTSI